MTTAKKTTAKKTATKKTAAKTTAGKKTAAKKTAGKRVVGKKATAAKTAGTKRSAAKGATAAASIPKAGKDPKGGLTAAGRAFFKEKDGSNLRPGVRGKADTPEKMMRKGSFLRRHYATPPGPVVDGKGEPTRQALQAAAWGEPVPKNEADERALAEKGSKLLERYHAAKGDGAKGAAKGKGKGGGASSH